MLCCQSSWLRLASRCRPQAISGSAHLLLVHEHTCIDSAIGQCDRSAVLPLATFSTIQQRRSSEVGASSYVAAFRLPHCQAPLVDLLLLYVQEIIKVSGILGTLFAGGSCSTSSQIFNVSKCGLREAPSHTRGSSWPHGQARPDLYHPTCVASLSPRRSVPPSSQRTPSRLLEQ